MSDPWRQRIQDDLDCKAPEPRWPIIVALLAIVALHQALPERITLGPSWLLAALVIPLLIPTSIAHRLRLPDLNRWLGMTVQSIVTAFMLFAVTLLVQQALYGKISGRLVFISAALLWITNVLVFAVWYWRLDAGGPNARESRARHEHGAFLFPQMTMDDTVRRQTSMENWSPGFVDYLFLAYNTSTALSPADTAALSRWAKLLMIVQSLVSLSIIVLLAARAVNTL